MKVSRALNWAWSYNKHKIKHYPKRSWSLSWSRNWIRIVFLCMDPPKGMNFDFIIPQQILWTRLFFISSITGTEVAVYIFCPCIYFKAGKIFLTQKCHILEAKNRFSFDMEECRIARSSEFQKKYSSIFSNSTQTKPMKYTEQFFVALYCSYMRVFVKSFYI